MPPHNPQSADILPFGGPSLQQFPPIETAFTPEWAESLQCEEDEGLADFLRGGQEWLNGFGFGMFATLIVIAIGATLWMWLS